MQKKRDNLHACPSSSRKGHPIIRENSQLKLSNTFPLMGHTLMHIPREDVPLLLTQAWD